VQVVGVTAPEDAKTVGFEYLELAIQNVVSLPDAEFDRTVARLKAIGIPLVSGYGFLPADLKVVGPDVSTPSIDEQLRHSLTRAQRLGLTMVVYGNSLTKGRSAPEGFPQEKAWQQLVDSAAVQQRLEEFRIDCRQRLRIHRTGIDRGHCD